MAYFLRVRWRQNNLKQSVFWCIVLKLVITFPCIISDCLGVNISLSLYPKGDINIKYGSPLEIFCIAENSSSTAEDLVFSLGSNTIPSEVINSTTRRLFIEKPEVQLNTYYCKNKNNSKICPTRVLVESLPSNVTDFGCVSSNLDVLNCSWTSPPDAYSKINYTLYFILNGLSVKDTVQTENVFDTYYCIWNATTQPRYRQQVEFFTFHLKSCNRFGCNEQNFFIDHFAIVKPEKPKILSATPSPHSVILKWNISFNMVDLLACGVDHKIEYQIAKIDNISTFHPVDTSKLASNKPTYELELELPYAHQKYDVRIYIKPKRASDKFWSDLSYVVFTTASEIPKMPPGIIAGSFNQALYENKRVIYVYWKQLEEYDEAGDNFTYKAVVLQNDKKQTLFPDKNEKSYLELNDASLDAINVAVWSSNEIGLSVNSSNLYIPPESETSGLTLKSFTQVANKNGTYELSWVGFENIDNYSLFWCEHHSTKVCSGRMDYLVLDAHKNNHTIHLPTGLRYQFAISANNGTATSGMVWAICDIAKEGIKLYNFPVYLDHDAPGKSFVNLKWSLVCAINEEIITGYNITYCPVIQTSTECDNTVGNTSVYISDPKQMFTNITELLPFRTYQFTIALNTTSGLKSIENTTHSVTTLEDVPTEPRNVLIEIEPNSVVVSWDPPKYRNGNIRESVAYMVNNDTTLHETDSNLTDFITRRSLTLPTLQGFTNYTFFVRACNIALQLCSQSPTNGSTLRTTIGVPSRVRDFDVKTNPDFLQWNAPEASSSANIDLYQIRRVNNGDVENYIIYNTTDLLYEVKHCVDVKDVSYQVRAVNFDEDLYHGALAFDANTKLPERVDKQRLEYPSEWSDVRTVNCQYGDGLTMVLIIMTLFVLIGMGYGTYKLYKKYRKIQDIKPVLPVGLGIPEKDISKYAFISSKDDKPSSDEALLLPNAKSPISPPDNKQKQDNCDASDQTDTTALSDTSKSHIERQPSTSDDGSNSSLHLEADTIKINEGSVIEEEEEYENTSRSESESSHENSPCFSNKVFKKNPNSGYVQPVTATHTIKSPISKHPIQPTSSSYVLASLAPSVLTAAVSPLTTPNHSSRPSGYVLPNDVQPRSNVNVAKLGPTPTKPHASESLMTMPTLPLSKREADSSYIPLQSLDAMPSLKPMSLHNPVPLKSRASNGYISPGEAVISKHLNNMLSAGQLPEEPAILDPEMSPDAYCRFSWSTDPANDNLHSLLGESPTVDSTRN